MYLLLIKNAITTTTTITIRIKQKYYNLQSENI